MIPPSGVVKPGEVERRLHTNSKIMAPTGGFPATGAELPVVDWVIETPVSLACAHRLVTVANGCNPYLVSTNPKGGSHAIAIVGAGDYAAAHGVPAAASDLAVFYKVLGVALGRLRDR
jgi:hypothetical protein